MIKKSEPQPLPESRLEEELAILRGLPAREPQAAWRGRERFLAEIKSLNATPNTPAHPWDFLKNIFSGSRRSAFSPLLAIVLAVAILLAGAGTTVYAAQGSQPDEAFYPLKLWSEQVRLQLAGDPQARLQLDREFAERRFAEVIAMNQAGKSARPEVNDRLQALLDDAIQNASTLPGEGAKQALSALSANLARHQEQLETMSQNANPRAAAEFARVAAMLELKQELAAQGERDPQALQELMRTMQAENQEMNGSAAGGAGSQKTVSPENEAAGKGNPQPGAQTTRTPHANGQGTPENPGKGKGDK